MYLYKSKAEMTKKELMDRLDTVREHLKEIDLCEEETQLCDSVLTEKTGVDRTSLLRSKD